MSHSLMEHMAAAPPNVHQAIDVMLRLLVATPERRRAALAQVRDPELRQAIRDRLPPAGLPVEAQQDEAKLLIVEVLGDEHGGTQWLRAMRGKLWHPPTEEET